MYKNYGDTLCASVTPLRVGCCAPRVDGIVVPLYSNLRDISAPSTATSLVDYAPCTLGKGITPCAIIYIQLAHTQEIAPILTHRWCLGI